MIDDIFRLNHQPHHILSYPYFIKVIYQTTSSKRMSRYRTFRQTDEIYHYLKKASGSFTNKEIVILESQLDEHPESERTYVAAFPKKKLRIDGLKSSWIGLGEDRMFKENPWEVLKAFRKESEWLFGYIGYDMKNSIENLQSENRTLYKAPDLFMMEPSLLFKIENGEVEQLAGDPIAIPEQEASSETGSFCINNINPEISKTGYREAVDEIKHLISEGDFYEMNYSYPISADFRGDAYDLFRRMSRVSPVPFASYLETEDFAVCCNSPERFLKKSGDLILSEPIKGTSGRSKDPVEDRKYRDELKSEKNEAENLMIVDLVRHDLSKVTRPGSINVSKLYDIQSFGTVHQLISRVEGELKRDTDPVDAIKACFPMGSMTGAPKLRVMKQIEDMELYRRGIYSGAIGYFDPKGDFDFNVVIRSCIVQNNRIFYPVGGAITGDSQPEDEWEETKIKARVLTSL